MNKNIDYLLCLQSNKKSKSFLKTLAAFQLTDMIKNVTLDNKTFTKDGDLMTGYDILKWNKVNISTIDKNDLHNFKDSAKVCLIT